jgi:hypothetical protein
MYVLHVILKNSGFTGDPHGREYYPLTPHPNRERMYGKRTLCLLDLGEKASSKHVQQARLAIRGTAMLRLDI